MFSLTNGFTGSLLIQDSMFTNGRIFYIDKAQDGLSSLIFLLMNTSYHSNSGNLYYPGNVFQSLKNLTIDNCHFEGNVGNPSFHSISNSNIYLKGNTTFANHIGVQGGAMNLVSSYLYLDNDSNITFINNSVIDVGGAIYNDDRLCGNVCHNCFYQLPKYLTRPNTSVFFINNTSTNGGDDVYGASFKSQCQVNDNAKSYEIQDKVFQFIDKPGHDLSQVAAKPERVGLCDEKGQPQCANSSYIVQHRTLTPGEKFNLSMAVVGGDFGTVTGVVYAVIIEHSSYFSGGEKISAQYTSSPVCTSLEYSICSSGNSLSLLIVTDIDSEVIDISILNVYIDKYYECHYMDDHLRVNSVQIKIDIQTCPLGLSVNNSTYTCVTIL